MATKNVDLFGDVELESGRVRVVRTKVDVPASVLKVLREAQAANQRAIWPVKDALQFDAMADVFYSAGELMQATVTPAPVKDTGKVDKNGKKIYEVAKRDADAWTATHVRVHIGKRRGRTKGANTTVPAAEGTPDTAKQ